MDIKSRLKCKDLKKQDCVIGGQCMALWEEHINALELGESYELDHVIVKEFDGIKYLTYTDKT